MESRRSGSPRETVAAILVAIPIVAAISWALAHREDGADDTAEPVALTAPVSMASDIRTGTLANGLRYYVKSNDSPEERAEFRLVVHAGSVLEDDDQRGLAHAVEHMAFRGTRRFPGRAIDEYMQSIGMRLGDDLNATTGYDETVYRLTIPTDRRGAVDTALTILAEWAHAVTFDPEQARQEGPIVFEEWRARRDADERLNATRDTLLLRGSRYATRAVIGDTASLRRFDIAAMRRFYRDWYRPDLIAVVAVGDFDARSIERALRRHFDRIPARTDARAKPPIGTPRPVDARVVTLRDPEVTVTRVSLWYPRTPAAQRTVSDYRRDLVERIGRAILRDRLEREADRAGSPLLSAGISLREPARAVEAHVIGAIVVDGRLPDGLAVLASVVARLARFGPTGAELDGVKESILRERREALAGPPESSDLAEALVEHALGGDPVPSAIDEYEWTDELLGEIGAPDITRFLGELATEGAPTVLVTAATGRGPALSPRAGLIAAFDSATARVAEQEAGALDASVLGKHPPRPGSVRSRRTLTGIDTQEWVLSNGMRLLLKPTRFSDDEVLLRVAAPGGASLASPDDYPSAYMADKVIEAMGVGEVSGYELSRILDERSVSLSPTVTDERIEMTGSGRRGDLELMLQVVYLYLTAPREDPDAFARYRERLRTFARSRAADPYVIFDDTVAATLRPGDPRALYGTARFVDAIDLARAARFWRERVTNASNMTAVLVGDFEIWQVSPLIERYLASLPAGHPERPADVGHGRIDRQIQRTVNGGVEPQAQTRIVFGDATELTLEADAALNATRDLLDLVLQSRLREELSGTYGVSVDLTIRRAPSPTFAFTIEFSADPARIDTLANAAIAEIERLRVRGPTRVEASKVREAAIRHDDEGSHGNGYWANELVWHALNGWSLEAIADHGEDAERITEASLKEASARFLDGRRFVRVTRFP